MNFFNLWALREFLRENAPKVKFRRQISVLAVKNVVKFTVTKFKPVLFLFFPGEK